MPSFTFYILCILVLKVSTFVRDFYSLYSIEYKKKRSFVFLVEIYLDKLSVSTLKINLALSDT